MFQILAFRNVYISKKYKIGSDFFSKPFQYPGVSGDKYVILFWGSLEVRCGHVLWIPNLGFPRLQKPGLGFRKITEAPHPKAQILCTTGTQSAKQLLMHREWLRGLGFKGSAGQFPATFFVICCTCLSLCFFLHIVCTLSRPIGPKIMQMRGSRVLRGHRKVTKPK